MRVHRCEWPNCRELVPPHYRWCKKHYAIKHESYVKHVEEQKGSERRKQLQQRYNATGRDRERNAFYNTGRWHHVRDYVYARDKATCQSCGNIVDDRKIVDHIKALRVDPTDALNTENLWLLCYKCHSRKPPWK